MSEALEALKRIADKDDKAFVGPSYGRDYHVSDAIKDLEVVRKALKRNDPMPLRKEVSEYSYDNHGSGYWPKGTAGYDKEKSISEFSFFTTCCDTHLLDIEEDEFNKDLLPNYCPNCGQKTDKENFE